MPRLLSGVTALLLLSLVSTTAAQDTKWVSLFDGKTLKGWEKRGGTAEFVVENGTDGEMPGLVAQKSKIIPA